MAVTELGALDPRVREAAAAYEVVRAQTEHLSEPLSPEDQTVQTMADVSPTKWHRAHTTWFFETFLLGPNVPGYVEHHPAYGYLFNSYYEGVGERHPRPERGNVSRPGAAEVGAYRRHVDAAMADLLRSHVAADPRVSALVELGLHHEQQHQELLVMDAKHVLGTNPLRPAYTAPDPAAPHQPPAGWREIEGGVVAIGAPSAGFSFDNERPRHDILIQACGIRRSLVTCGEWLAFMADDGYRRAELWMSEGWATVQACGWRAPLYWTERDGSWHVYTLHGERPVADGEPVCHVSWFEADAFARWAGARLPTEAEWEQAAGDPPPSLGVQRGRLQPGAAAGDAEGWYGQVWQWTASPYTPYPGFRTAPGAVGEYNGKFMVNQQVLRGSCCATPAGHARRTYRNFFPPASRWAFSGLRLAR